MASKSLIALCVLLAAASFLLAAEAVASKDAGPDQYYRGYPGGRPGGGYPGGGYPGGRPGGGYPGGGYPGGGHGGYPGGCSYGCCYRPYVRAPCGRCCRYAGEAVVANP